jgi:hypothetical protein
VKRNFLLDTLVKELPKGTIRYSSKIVAIEEDGDVKVLHLADDTIIRAKVRQTNKITFALSMFILIGRFLN